MKTIEGLKLNKFEYVAVPSRRNFYNRLTDARITQYTSEKVDSTVDFMNVRKTDIEQVRLNNLQMPSVSEPESPPE